MRLSRTEIVLLPVLMLGTVALAYEGYRLVGFLGIGTLGLLIGFIAVQVDLEKGGAVGGSQTQLYAQHMASRAMMSRSERAAYRAAVESTRRPLLIAKVIAAVLIVLGAVGFFLSG